MKEFRLFLAEKAEIDTEESRAVLDFLNLIFDAYVHGAYETTMELYDPVTGRFMMRGHPLAQKRQEFVTHVCLKLHEVVCAIELTAAVTPQPEVLQAVGDLRRAIDNSEPWKRT